MLPLHPADQDARRHTDAPRQALDLARAPHARQLPRGGRRDEQVARNAVRLLLELVVEPVESLENCCLRACLRMWAASWKKLNQSWSSLL
jgi:hypothetical protein